MFDYICGKVTGLETNAAVVDVAGVGFRLLVPQPLREKLKEGEVVKIFVSLSLRNEEVKLYGFAGPDERKMFEKLQTVSGIGPATALNILSGSTLSSLYEAILQEDFSVFKRVKGVGTKTAQRIVLELKGKLSPSEVRTAPADSPGPLQADAVAALVALGYPQENAWDAVHKAWKNLPAGSPSLEVLIRTALQQLQSP